MATTTQTLTQIHTTAQAVNGAVKNAMEARNHLFSKGWMAPGETVALEVLARILFAIITDGPKLPPAASTNILAVAHIITEKLEEGIMEKTANHVSLHIKDTLDSLTSDLHIRLDQHIQAASETTQTQKALTEKLIKAQEHLDETTQKAVTTARTYSQVAATAPTPNIPAPTSQISLDQVRMRNREEIKKRQVLIEFDRTQDRELENMDETVLARKAKDAISTAWAISPGPKPEIPKIKAAVLLRNGGLLLELDNAEAAEWLHKDDNRKNVLNNIGSGANIKDRTYQVIVSFIPVEFTPDNDNSLRRVETDNGLQPNTVMKMEWIKPIADRKEHQRVATARVYLRDAKLANAILSHGAYIHGRKVVPKKPRKEPIRCLKCQMFGHERRHCASPETKCARCARPHETAECRAPLRMYSCSNCGSHHPSYDRNCPRFVEKCEQLDARCPENNLAFYPTDDPWSWATFDARPEYTNHETQYRERRETQELGYQTNYYPGANNPNDPHAGGFRHPNAQPHPAPFQ